MAGRETAAPGRQPWKTPDPTISPANNANNANNAINPTNRLCGPSAGEVTTNFRVIFAKQLKVRLPLRHGAQDLLGMLAQPGRRPCRGGPQPVERDRQADHLGLA